MASERPATRSISPLLAILASIGGLFLFGILMLILLIVWILRSGPGMPTKPNGDLIGVIHITGVISDPEPTLKQLRAFEKKENIKAVIVRINSPGGSVGPSQEIYSQLKKLNKKIPVVASLSSIAASGGYYIAVGAKHIVANPGTITGSIGVIMHKPNISGLLKKIGIKATVIKSGALKDLGNITRDLTDEEKAVLESVLHDIHSQFIQAVSESRQLPLDQVRQIADGRIFTGRQAKGLHLIDTLGNFSDAVDKASQLGNIQGTPQLYYPEKDKWALIMEALEERTSLFISHIISNLTSSQGGAFLYEQ